jgi:hypothetical protein
MAAELPHRRQTTNFGTARHFHTQTRCHPEPQAKDLRLFLRMKLRRNFRLGDNPPVKPPGTSFSHPGTVILSAAKDLP